MGTAVFQRRGSFPRGRPESADAYAGAVAARETHTLSAPPEIKADTGTEWNRESVKVTVTMTAEAEAAGMRSQYKIGSEGKWTDYTAPILVEAEGETIVYARAATMSGVRSDEASRR